MTDKQIKKMRESIAVAKDKKEQLVNSDKKIPMVWAHKLVHPLLCSALKVRRVLNGHTLTIISNKSKIDKNKPVIYAITHVGNYDFEMVMQAIKKFFYVLAGDWDLSFGTVDEYFFKANGAIFVDENDKRDKQNSLKMCIKALNQGIPLVWYPEGTWNLDPAKPMLDLYSGIIKAALITGVEIVPIAVDQRNEKDFYINIGENIDIKSFDGEDERKELRDILAGLKYEIWEMFPVESRRSIPDNYFESFVQARLKECTYIPKSVFESRVYQKELPPKGERKEGFRWLTREEEKALSPEEYEKYYYDLRELYEKSFLYNLTLKQRKLLHPLVLAGITARNYLSGFRLKVLADERTKTNRPIIFAASHICKYDIELLSQAIKSHFYLLMGDFESIHDTSDGFFLGLNGVEYFNEKNREDRKSVRERMIKILQSGGNMLYFPEGTWNLTKCKLVNPLFNGIIDVAKETDAIIVPIGIEQYGKQFIAKIGKNFDVKEYASKEEAKKHLRDALATLRWDIFSSVKPFKRAEIPDDYYEKMINERIGEWELSLDVYEDAIYKEKGVVTAEEVFAPIIAATNSQYDIYGSTLCRKKNKNI